MNEISDAVNIKICYNYLPLKAGMGMQFVDMPIKEHASTITICILIPLSTTGYDRRDRAPHIQRQTKKEFDYVGSWCHGNLAWGSLPSVGRWFVMNQLFAVVISYFLLMFIIDGTCSTSRNNGFYKNSIWKIFLSFVGWYVFLGFTINCNCK